MTKYYPMMMDIKNKKCLVVGGGNVALRKIVNLIEYGGIVTLVSREINANMKRTVAMGDKQIIHIADNYKYEYIKDAFIVIAATNDRNINLQIASDCGDKNIIVNVVDDLESSKFIVPAKVTRGDLTISISTNGKCPFYSKLLRSELELQFDDSYSTVVNMLGDFRKELLINIVSDTKRKEIMASLDVEYYIKRLGQIGEQAALKEMEAYVYSFGN